MQKSLFFGSERQSFLEGAAGVRRPSPNRDFRMLDTKTPPSERTPWGVRRARVEGGNPRPIRPRIGPHGAPQAPRRPHDAGRPTRDVAGAQGPSPAGPWRAALARGRGPSSGRGSAARAWRRPGAPARCARVSGISDQGKGSTVSPPAGERAADGVPLRGDSPKVVRQGLPRHGHEEVSQLNGTVRFRDVGSKTGNGTEMGRLWRPSAGGRRASPKTASFGTNDCGTPLTGQLRSSPDLVRYRRASIPRGSYPVGTMTRLSDLQATAASLWSRFRMHSGEGGSSSDSP